MTYYYVVSQHNPNLVLDIFGGSRDQEAKLIVWTYNGNDNQKFRINDDGTIVSKHSGHCLDISGGVVKGHNIIQYSFHGGDNQRWRYHDDGTIRLRNGALVLDIKGGSRDAGAEVIGWELNGQTNQKWTLRKA
eukprot:TRINITY_DN88_c0_g1_i3.p1 TRINITY_DN88_c0_g1~~TRINITY_DN88_c0_g1_i3.p1  ORF type:complete len:133 (-),score=54.82 TRINITY_DN88_c0_g1_i3:123-521(-)